MMKSRVLLYFYIDLIFVFCNGDKFNYRHHLSTKTAYRFLENWSEKYKEYPRCNATRIWSTIRHGSRSAGTETSLFIRTRLLDIRKLIVEYNEESEFNDWLPEWEEGPESRLSETGKMEMIGLGQRLRKRFSSILPDWNNSTYSFYYSPWARSKDTAEHFWTGMFGIQGKDVQPSDPVDKYNILQFGRNCEKWSKLVEKGASTLDERKKFMEGEKYTSIVKNVNRRLNLPLDSLNTYDIDLMYKICALESAWYDHSLWCNIFTDHEFEILEYSHDLLYYWIYGYRYELSSQIGCLVLNDVYTHLISNTDPSAVFYFSHTRLILPLLSHLGLYRDEQHLLHNNFAENRERRWRTSILDPFGSNIVFVLYECDAEKYILTLHEEKPITLPGCPSDVDLCPWDAFVTQYGEMIASCDFEKLCSMKEPFMQYIINLLWELLRFIERLYSFVD